MVSFRLPQDAVDYYSAEARANNMGKVDIVLEAIYLDRDLGRRLSALRARLGRAANGMGLNLDRDLADVLANLVEVALDAIEQKTASSLDTKQPKK